MGHEHRPPAQRIAALLDEREQYIKQQEQLRQERMEIELKLLLLMIDERAAKDPHLVREIRNTHVGEEELPSFNALYKEWRSLGFELDRQHSYQQRAEIDIATCVLDTDQTVIADLDEAFETVRFHSRGCAKVYAIQRSQQTSPNESSISGDEVDGTLRTDGGTPRHDPAYQDAPEPDRKLRSPATAAQSVARALTSR